MRRSGKTLAAWTMAGLAGLYGSRGQAAPTISTFYIDGEFAADSGFTTGVQSVSMIGTSPTVFVPVGDYFEFGVATVITGNLNSTAGDAWDLANQAQGNPAQPTRLGLASVEYSVGSTDTNASKLAPVENGPRGGMNDYWSTSVLPNSTPIMIVDPGDVQPGNGQVGITYPIFQGGFSADVDTSSGVATLALFAGSSATVSQATPFFTQLAYQAVGAGLVGLYPALNTSGGTDIWIPKTPGTVNGNDQVTSDATYSPQALSGVTVASPPVLAVRIAPGVTWDGQADHTTWNTSVANWNSGVNPASTYADSDIVFFGDSAPSNGTSVTLNATVSPDEVAVNSNSDNYTFSGSGAIAGSAVLVKQGTSQLTITTDNTFSGGTTISGGTLQVGNGGSSGSIGSGAITNNGALVYDLNGSAAVANAISGAGTLTQSGTGTLTLSGANSYSGATTVNAGTLIAGAAGALPSGDPLAINGSATVKLASETGLESLSSLAIAANATLDIANNHFILDYSGSDPRATILQYLTRGSNGGHWNGTGITSSTAAATSGYGVGFADGADGVDASLGSGQIEVMYTLYGDANLDGVVNGTDFGILAAHFGQQVTGWDQGDFNYDGVVNGSDFGALAANFGQQVNGGAVALPASDWAALDSFAAASGLMADVPEPASGGLVGLLGILLLRCRRASH
jgi:autotransporter-associated beta strand protein